MDNVSFTTPVLAVPIHHPASIGSLATPNLWLVAVIFLACYVVLTNGLPTGRPTATPQPDCDKKELFHTILYRPTQQGGIPEWIKVERSPCLHDLKLSWCPPPEASAEAIARAMNKDRQILMYQADSRLKIPLRDCEFVTVEQQPCSPVHEHVLERVAPELLANYKLDRTLWDVLMALVCISILSLALVIPTVANMPTTPLTLPCSSVYTPTTDPVSTAPATNVTFGSPEKRVVFYSVGNSSARILMQPFLMLIPLLLIVFFSSRALAADPPETETRTEDDVDVDLVRRTAADTLSPVWEIYYSTTTIWLPTVTVTAPPVAKTNPSDGVSGGWQHAPQHGVCTEKDPAACPIVLGRKPGVPTY